MKRRNFLKHVKSSTIFGLTLPLTGLSTYSNSLKKILRETAKNVFIPITAGGGIKTLKDSYELLNNGADKISVNTAAVKNPKFLELLVKEFGSSTISVSIDTLQFKDLKYYIFTDYGRENSGKILSNQDVADFYEFALKEGEKLNVDPCLEVHVNM